MDIAITLSQCVCVGVCVCQHNKTKTNDQNDLKLGTLVVLDTLSKPIDWFWGQGSVSGLRRRKNRRRFASPAECTFFLCSSLFLKLNRYYILTTVDPHRGVKHGVGGAFFQCHEINTSRKQYENPMSQVIVDPAGCEQPNDFSVSLHVCLYYLTNWYQTQRGNPCGEERVRSQPRHHVKEVVLVLSRLGTATCAATVDLERVTSARWPT